MAFHLDRELPQELLPFKERIESTIKPYVEIKARRDENVALKASRIGGLPCLPKGAQYPLGAKGEPLSLLAQINFAETPPLQGFPDRGLLQFYISSADSLYGVSFNDLRNQAGFRVVYWPGAPDDEASVLTSYPAFPREAILPFEGQCALDFIPGQAPISPFDYQFAQQILGKDLPEWSEERRAVAAPYEEFFQSLAAGHRIVGYPFFVQTDPRYDPRYRNEGYILLLQIDTDYQAGIMWGDAGVGNFFIRERDLQQRDFSSVLYSWDCG